MHSFENKYMRLFESAKDGILILNADNGKIEDVNPYLANLLGYSKKRLLKKSIWDISAVQNIEYSKHLYKELQDKKYVRYEDVPLQASDGSLIDVEIVSNVYKVNKEKVIQCNIRDISKRKSLEKKFQENIKTKEALLKELQHRTINSFTVLISLIRLRGQMAGSDETKLILEDLETKIKSITDLYSLLSECNSFYEVKLDLYFNKMIERMSALSKNIVMHKNIEEISVSDKKAATLGMILVELLFNAIKYAFPDSKKGEINITVKSKDGLTFIVEDNGVGLKKDFDFNRDKGLGLELVDMMVNQLNGNINFKSEKGTKIVMGFPS
ncbi:MAG TPA: PAS domain S-box protein [Ignavibacteriaceae bacterium]|nr:PAS domain S-box protein [Ignavibacteriaceae bacterium]